MIQTHRIHQEAARFEEAALSALGEAAQVIHGIKEGVKGASYHQVIEITVTCPDQTDPTDDDQRLAGLFGAPPQTVAFWTRLGRVAPDTPDLMAALEHLIDATEQLFSAWTQEKVSALCGSSSEVQFGEIEALCLGIGDRRCVPFYTRLLLHWDMEHEVHQYDAIARLARLHGPSPEIDDLIAARLINAAGQHGLEQFIGLWPQIKTWYDDPKSSPIFARALHRMGKPAPAYLIELFEGKW